MSVAEIRSSTSSSTASYGQVISPAPLSIPRDSYPSISSNPDSPKSPYGFVPASPQRTLDDVRAQAAESIAVKAITKAETVDSSKIGVILTLSRSSDPHFLTRIASAIKRALFTSSYLFAITSSGTPGSTTPLLLSASSEELVSRAVMLVGSKFLGRLQGRPVIQNNGARWLGLVKDLGSTPYDQQALWDVVRKAARAPMDPTAPPPGSLGIDQILELARARLERITPRTAYGELCDSSSPWPVILVDIRPQEQRQSEGMIGGALVIERNVLEWRLDPRCASSLPIAGRYDLRVIVFCSEGYTSSLAAASLHDLGLLNATDMIGGYKAWKAAGLPAEVLDVNMDVHEANWM